MGDEERKDASMFGDAPSTGAPDEDVQAELERCRLESETLTGKETADCAGLQVAEAYENEEDGGS
jgi:hypothetical protein